MAEKFEIRMQSLKKMEEILNGLMAADAIKPSLAMPFYLISIAILMEKDDEVSASMLGAYFEWHPKYVAWKEEKMVEIEKVLNPEPGSELDTDIQNLKEWPEAFD